MTKDDDMDFPDDDFNIGGDMEPENEGKFSLKDLWEANPMLKSAAAISAAVIVIGVVLTFFSGNDIEKPASIVQPPKFDVNVTPGESGLDKEYVEAMQKENEERVAEAKKSGGSSLPTPIGGSELSGIEVAQDSNLVQDPLKEWKETIAAARKIRLEDTVEENIIQPAPEIVPMVQPVRPQATAQIDPKAAQALAGQMRVIIATQVPSKVSALSVTQVPNDYQKDLTRKEELKKQATSIRGNNGTLSLASLAGTSKSTSKKGDSTDRVILAAGQIFYAQLITELNSDTPGPALAMVLSGPFRGGRALGQMQVLDEMIAITFNQIIKDDVVYKINGIAVDEATTLPATRTGIDHHYFSRVILPAASEFVSSYSAALAETGTSTTTTSGGGVASETPAPTPKESLYKGMESATSTVTDFMKELAPDGPTIRVARGATMGVLLLDSITTDNAQ